MSALTRLLRRFLRRQDGTATVEFVILFPAFMILMVSGFEAGMLMTRQMMLERGLDLTMRELRLGGIDDPTAEKVKDEVCKNARIIPNCRNVVMLELSPVDKTSWNIPIDGNHCVDRTQDIQPAVTFNPGKPDELLVVRVCAVFNPMFPATGLGAHLPKDASGGYRLMATSAFVNEP